MQAFHITTGDTDGIGLEITLKSLPKIINKSKGCCFYIWIHSKQVNTVQSFLKKNPKISPYVSFLNSEERICSSKFIFLVNNKNSPAHWFVSASKDCIDNGDSIITGPLSKTQIAKEGFKEIGHTDLLKKLTKTNDLNMAFVGKYFSVILFTDHIPISKLELNLNDFDRFVSRSIIFHKKISKIPNNIRLLGFNPHAGDSGLIGKEDSKILSLVHKKYKINKLWPADSAFIEFKNFKDKPTFLAMYHDQGLIPFKLVHGYTGYHHTIGLPFVRTSVDHGTAKDIFNLDKANPKSMIDAILGAINLRREKRHEI